MKTYAFLALLSLAACAEPETPPLGSLSITAAAPTIQQGFTTLDGWNVKYTQFLVHFSTIDVAGNDGVLTASTSAQVFDLAAAEAPVLVSSDNRIARAWENVSFEIAPATADSTAADGIPAEAVAAMAEGGFSVFVTATLTKGAETKTLKAGFTPDTKYEACTGPLNGFPTPGLVVPKDGADNVAVGFAGDVLFFDNLVTRGHGLRAEPFKAADANNDGTIDNTELAAVTLASLRPADNTSPLYEPPPGVEDLNGYLDEQVRSIVTTFRDAGACTATAVTAAP